MEYADHFAAHLRITLLRLLAAQPAYKANSSLLTDAADSVGLTTTRDKVKTELAWLEEQNLVRLAGPDDRLLIATLTERGLDVAGGRVRVPGVKPPAP